MSEATITRLPRLSLAGWFLAGYRGPDPDTAKLDMLLISKLADSLNSDTAPLRALPPELVHERYRRFASGRLCYGTGWAIPGLAEAEGAAVFDVLDAHFAEGRERAKGRAAKPKAAAAA
jgi:hypothetical protein